MTPVGVCWRSLPNGAQYFYNNDVIFSPCSIKIADLDFISKLDEKIRKVAKNEFNELNEKDRELAVQTFRQWVLEQAWLKNPTSSFC